MADYKNQYEEALARAKALWIKANKAGNLDEMSKIESIFPEIAIEEDEKTRNQLIEYVKNWLKPNDSKYPKYTYNEDDCVRFIDWLKKQKPYKWSEKDIEMIDDIIDDIMPIGECPDYPTDKERDYYYNGQNKVEWLKQLKERFK